MRNSNDKVKLKLSDEALKNLAGFFDVLIQMDLQQKAKAKNSKQSTKKSKNIKTSS